jgi:NADH-quinone oxidoreductase subunit A
MIFAPAIERMDNQYLMDYLPIVLMFIVALGFVGTTMVATHYLGPKRKGQTKLDVFECGIEAKGNARVPFSIKYFLVAILFVLFDVEVIFMYPWAVQFKEMGMTGFIEMLVFVAFLLVGFFYILKKGALKWD